MIDLHKPLRPILGLLLGLGLSACAHQSPAELGIKLVQPKDLRVPAGMELKSSFNDMSHTVQAGSYRFAKLVYEGDTPVAQVASYMRSSMPSHNYKLITEERHGKNHEELVFQRGIYLVECSVKRHEFKTRLDIKLRTHP